MDGHDEQASGSRSLQVEVKKRKAQEGYRGVDGVPGVGSCWGFWVGS